MTQGTVKYGVTKRTNNIFHWIISPDLSNKKGSFTTFGSVNWACATGLGTKTTMVCRLLQKFCKFSAIKRESLNQQIFNRCVHYVQGQSPEPRIREYFYYIDHQGQVTFLWKSCVYKQGFVCMLCSVICSAELFMKFDEWGKNRKNE